MSPKKKAFIEAYKKSFGNITVSAKTADINRSTYYDWMRDDPEFKKAIDNTEPDELFVDFAENALAKKVQSGDTTAIIFSLKTRGKKRGYVEKQEIEHSGNITIQPLSYADYTTSQLQSETVPNTLIEGTGSGDKESGM